MENAESAQNEEKSINCSYCVQTSVPAIKTCIHCEASVCEEHLKAHSKSPDHVMVEPTTSIKDMKCPIHDKLIEFCCSQDGACICVSCCIVGEHRGHKVDPLKDAFEKRKASLKDIIGSLTLESEENERKLEKLQKTREMVEEAASGVNERVAALFRDLKEQLGTLESKATSEISRQEEQATARVSTLIQQHEKKKKELSDKISTVKELQNVTDPLTVLKGTPHEAPQRRNSRKDSEGDASVPTTIDESSISLMLHMGLQTFADSVLDLKALRKFSDMKKTILHLDMKTAHCKILLSEDLKSASHTATPQKYPETPERFKTCQVLSTAEFTSGQHYWEVDVSEAPRWIVGVAYNSIARKVAGNDSFIGYNAKSWSLFFQKYLGTSHNNVQTAVGSDEPVKRVGVHLNYDSGHLSFYQLHPTRHLYTFTATFQEPLRAAFYVFDNCRLRIVD